MGKGRKAGRDEESLELVAHVSVPAAGRADPQRLVWGGDEWEPGDGESRSSEDRETVRFSVTPLHIGMGLALVAVGLVVPVAAAALTLWAFRRSSS